MSKKIYTVWTCDRWKDRDSMRLLMATTSVRKLKSLVARKIADETFTYDKGDELSIPKQVAQFKCDFLHESLGTLNDGLCFGFLDSCCDGEEL